MRYTRTTMLSGDPNALVFVGLIVRYLERKFPFVHVIFYPSLGQLLAKDSSEILLRNAKFLRLVNCDFASVTMSQTISDPAFNLGKGRGGTICVAGRCHGKGPALEGTAPRSEAVRVQEDCFKRVSKVFSSQC